MFRVALSCSRAATQSLIASSLIRCALPTWYERSFPSLISRYRVGMDTPMVWAANRSDGGWSLPFA